MYWVQGDGRRRKGPADKIYIYRDRLIERGLITQKRLPEDGKVKGKEQGISF